MPANRNIPPTVRRPPRQAAGDGVSRSVPVPNPTVLLAQPRAGTWGVPRSPRGQGAASSRRARSPRASRNLAGRRGRGCGPPPISARHVASTPRPCGWQGLSRPGDSGDGASLRREADAATGMEGAGNRRGQVPATASGNPPPMRSPSHRTARREGSLPVWKRRRKAASLPPRGTPGEQKALSRIPEVGRGDGRGAGRVWVSCSCPCLSPALCRKEGM